ncbi:hypothetical protein ABZS93_26015 [Streptomyces sp900116325]|uniref:hypothetical protein n=1 Tax=Streptomyces sp. 900116325 TaxID=3154295 RepID=UPI0033B991C6
MDNRDEVSAFLRSRREERFRVFVDLEAGIGNQRAQLALAEVGPGISVGELGLRCRVLSFLNTPYFDDVRQTRPEISAPGFELVATDDSGTVLGAMDVTVEAARRSAPRSPQPLPSRRAPGSAPSTRKPACVRLGCT